MIPRFTHVEHNNNDSNNNNNSNNQERTLHIPIESFQRQLLNIVPRSAILSARGATGGWSAPDPISGVAHHYVVGTADDDEHSKIASKNTLDPFPSLSILISAVVDLGYASFHPQCHLKARSTTTTIASTTTNTSPSAVPSQSVLPSPPPVFLVAAEADMLVDMCISHKKPAVADDKSRLEVDAAIKTPLFKHKMSLFFQHFPVWQLFYSEVAFLV